jgi:Cu(I)-responsive transcriptional regulator
MTRSMNIGEAAEAAGVSAKMIRHYEQIGLMAAASRTQGGYRQYGERDVSVLRFIRQSRRIGFSIEQIADLLGLWSNHQRPSRMVRELARQHLIDLEQKMREIAEMAQALERLVASCNGSDDPHCAILAELAVHSPLAPESAAIGTARLRKTRARETRAAAKREMPSSSQVDLMAWARLARAGNAANKPGAESSRVNAG